ncbi:fungal peroxidase [Mycena rebaudengoi]|nr:fungal peroxidase [Mycena rebaudengoi]
MKVPTSPSFVCLSFLFGVQLASALSLPSLTGIFSRGVAPGRTNSLLINPDAFPDLPTAAEAKAASAAANLNLTDIQGDILIGMSKKRELFFFFSIADPTSFKSHLALDILPLVTSTTQLLSVSTQPQTALNIAFSQTGLTALGATQFLGDLLFSSGQFLGALGLGDPGTANWVPAFAGTRIHGGAARPGNQAGHEHFGYLDGISNPAVDGFTTTPKPGQGPAVPAGTLLLGENGDFVPRPAWAKDGSFLVFRQLAQLVPEFDKFVTNNAIVKPGLTLQQGADLLGARMVGRWKSGAPVDLAPLADDPALGADPNRNNDFTFSHPGEILLTNQTRCPFSAHIRKSRPRADLGTPEDSSHHIMRAGIPYGPEVTDVEAKASKTSTERGLAFVCYQSNIGQGFQFVQSVWSNSNLFAHGTGADPIVGAQSGAPRFITGLDPTNPFKIISLTTDFVVSRGGEYFFSPSLSAIANTLSV